MSDLRSTLRSKTASEQPAAAVAAPAVRSALWLDVVVFVAIVAAAFGLRLVYLQQQRSNPIFDKPIMDEHYHDAWAQAIVAGESFSDGPYFRAPLYPYLLAGIYRLAGHDYFTPRLVQSVLGALSCGLLFLVGRLAFTRAVGALAGFAAAGYWVLIYFDNELLIPSLVVFLDLLLLWLLFAHAQKPSWALVGLAGLTLGLSAIARPNILLFAPPVAVWVFCRSWPHWRRGLAHTVILTATTLVPILPVTIRNYAVGHDLVLIASQAGVNFYIGNNPQSDGLQAVVPGTPADWWGGYYAAIEQAEAARGRNLKPSEVSRYYFERAGQFMRTQPAQAASLLLAKLRWFWSAREISNNKDIYFWSGEFAPIVNWLPLNFAIVGPLGLLGLLLVLRAPRRLFPLWGFVLIYMVSVVLFFCPSRYRVPVLPPLILLASYALFWCGQTIRARRWLKLAGALCALALAAALVSIPPRDDMPTNREHTYLIVARSLYADGNIDRAIDYYRRAITVRDDYLSAHFNLGLVLANAGHIDEAIAEFRRALECPPQPLFAESPALYATVHENLGTALMQDRRPTEAALHFEQALRGDAPADEITLRCKLGSAYAAAEKTGPAEAAFRAALAANPQSDLAHFNLARLLSQTGRPAAAEHHYRAALQSAPRRMAAFEGLVRALLAQNRIEEAQATIRQALAVLDRPGDARQRQRKRYLLVFAELLEQAGQTAEAAQLRRRATSSPL